VDGDTLFGFHDVDVSFDGTPVLRRLDLAIPDRGVTVVVGPSGSGKSTLTRLCNRLIDATSGAVKFRGVDVREWDVLDLRRRVGMVFQRPTLFAGTVRDNLAATGVGDETAHAEVLSRVGLGTGHLDQSAATLSGGEAQRVCLARALLMQPEALVADEPTASLDEPSTRELERLACAAAESGVPLLWVTHDLAQLDRIADHGVVLADGQVAAAGSVETLREVAGGVAALLASPWNGDAPHDLRAHPRPAEGT
jgi:putative ABC transport system ATP-binding protein